MNRPVRCGTEVIGRVVDERTLSNGDLRVEMEITRPEWATALGLRPVVQVGWGGDG